MLVISDCN